MVAETVDAGLLRTAAERKNDERILVQIQEKDCVVDKKSTITKFATAIIQNFSRETQRSNWSLKDQLLCMESPMMFSVRK